MIKKILSAALVSTLLSTAAHAQSEAPREKEPRRIRLGLGAQVVPKFTGSEDLSVGPYWDVDIARGDKPFKFEAPGESASFSLIDSSGFEFGPSANLVGSRRRKDIDVNMDEVGISVEVGAFAQYWLTPAFRVRVEGRKGVTGHKAWVGSAGADFVARDGDKYVFSVGPRVSWSERKYQNAYFGVNPREAAATGLPAYRAGSGIHAVGAAAGLSYSLSEQWGVMGYAKYDRLIGDAADSPFIRTYGKRDQLSGGLGLTYTFGGNR
jgi:MipA family protein